MKKLIVSMVSLALIAMMVGPVAAGSLAVLKADLDADGDFERVAQFNSPTPTPSMKALFMVSDLDKDGDPDLIETRGMPVVLGQLAHDDAPEAVIQDAQMDTAWAVYGLGGKGADAIALVFVRGQVLGFKEDPNHDHQALVVSDPALAGTSADIDGDGLAEIFWVGLTAVYWVK
jgi:hypothetical protein